MTEKGRQAFRNFHEEGQVDTSIDAAIVEHMNQIFCANVASRAGGIRAAADAAKRRIETADAGVICGERIGQTHIAGVVQMKRQWQVGVMFADRRHKIADLPWIGDSDGIGHCDAFDAHVAIDVDGLQHPFHRLAAFEWTAERGGERGVHENPAACNDLHDVVKLGKRLLTGHAHVSQTMLFGNRHDEIDFVHLAFKSPLCAAYVGNQGGVLHVWRACEAAENLGGIAQIGDRFRGNE